MKSKILFIEDEQDLGNVVMQYLQIMDFDVEWYNSAEKALVSVKESHTHYDLMIVDVQLPGMDGFELVEKVKKLNAHIPFLFLTARNEKKDRILGLKSGADDYINKPFDVDELVLRIKNIIKRNKQAASPPKNHSTDIIIGDITLHKDLFKISIGSNNKQISLTPREVELLEYLYQHKNSILKRENILIQLWGENDYFLGRSLDVFISRLRKQLSSSTQVKIENVYGVGFIFNVKE